MRLEEYIPLAMRTNSEKTELDNLLNACLGLSGEYAEYITEVNTNNKYNQITKTRIKDELSDIYWYVALLHETLGFTEVNFHDVDDLLYYMATIRNCTLLSSIGAVNDTIKKHAFQGHTLDIEKMRCLVFSLTLCLDEEIDLHGFTPEEIREYNVEKLRKRFPDGFEIDKSVNRKE